MKQKTLRKAAGLLDDYGRGQDSLLAHITPQEAMALKAMGGSGTRNPKTGLLEFDPGDGGDAQGAAEGGTEGGDPTDQGRDVGPAPHSDPNVTAALDAAVAAGIFGGIGSPNPDAARAAQDSLAALGLGAGPPANSSFGHAVAAGLAGLLGMAPLASSFAATNALSGVGHGFGLAMGGIPGALAGLAGTIGDHGISGASLGKGSPSGPSGPPGAGGTGASAASPSAPPLRTDPLIIPEPTVTRTPTPEQLLAQTLVPSNYWRGNQFVIPGLFG